MSGFQVSRMNKWINEWENRCKQLLSLLPHLRFVLHKKPPLSREAGGSTHWLTGVEDRGDRFAKKVLHFSLPVVKRQKMPLSSEGNTGTLPPVENVKWVLEEDVREWQVTCRFPTPVDKLISGTPPEMKGQAMWRKGLGPGSAVGQTWAWLPRCVGEVVNNSHGLDWRRSSHLFYIEKAKAQKGDVTNA